MLRELKIENLAIIDELDIEFDKGFIVLTGETGAGKSIILSGINLLIGEKASVDMIRDGEENLVAQGVFDVDEEQKKALEAMGIDIDGDEIIIRRSYSRSGKARAFVNNVRISLTDLKEIASTLVDIVGQHSHQMLLNKNNHIKLLDSFLNKDEKDLKENLINLLSQYREIDTKIENIERERFYEKFQDKEEELLKAKVLRVHSDSIILDIDGTTVVLPPESQIPNRVYEIGEEVFVYLKKISRDTGGIVLDITQSSPDYVEAILKKIVPEFESGAVQIDNIARIAGKKTKILVSSTQD